MGMNEKIIKLDKAGYQAYLDEIKALRQELDKNTQYKSAAYASAVGDGWHDNFEFEDATRKEKMIQKQIEDKVADLRRIVIVEDVKSDDEININDYVLLINKLEDEEYDKSQEAIMKLVASPMPDIFAEIPELTINSPAGEALYGCKLGQTATYDARGGRYVIIPKFKSANLEDVVAFKEQNDEFSRTQK